MGNYVSDPARQAAFDAAYWAAQSPEVNAARQLDPVARNSAMMDLAKSGKALIDKSIMIWGWDPYMDYLDRCAQGFAWVPNVLQDSPPVPAFTQNNPAPVGSFLVHDANSYDLAAWFPPFAPPPPPPPPAPVTFVDLSRTWPDQGPNAFYSTVAGQSVPTGKEIQEDGKNWVKIFVDFPFGMGFHGFKQV